MRMHPSYTRVRDMITHEAVPRLPNGGVALCQTCQRDIYWVGGFLELLIKRIERMASAAGANQYAQWKGPWAKARYVARIGG
jgi:hypothetical protein